MWRIFVHGGATDSCPDFNRQNEIKSALSQVIAHSAKLLNGGAHAKDVVVEAVRALEDCSLFNAGKGSALTKDGRCELEAAVVDGSSARYGAVCCMTETKNPILTAGALAEDGPHCFLAGKAADDHTRHLGLDIVPNEYFVTPFRRASWQRSSQAQENTNLDDLRSSEAQENINLDETGTVGALVLDSHRNIAAGGSTGGTTGKMSGSIGGIAVLGAGLFADSRVAIVCSGTGDQILQHLVARKAAAYYSSGLKLASAIQQAVMTIPVSGKSCSIAAMDAGHGVFVSSTAKIFYTASGSSGSDPESVLQPTTCPCMSDHLVYTDDSLSIGLSRFPTARGQLVAQLARSLRNHNLSSLGYREFFGIMKTISEVAAACCQAYSVQRSALVTDGGDSIAIIPLHGLSHKWQPIRFDGTEFHEDFPGYITSKEGPTMSDSKLDEVCRQIQEVSQTLPPFNHTFFGDQSDANLFARIVRGELPQRRIWESKEHVAFLTPFANTTGFTVLVPRAHLPSDIFSLKKADYAQLIKAAYTVAHVLKSALGAQRIGMIFEGFEIDYAHVKLIPIRDPPATSTSLHTQGLIQQADYHESYPGYVTSLYGPTIKDTEPLSRDAEAIRELLE